MKQHLWMLQHSAVICLSAVIQKEQHNINTTEPLKNTIKWPKLTINSDCSIFFMEAGLVHTEARVVWHVAWYEVFDSQFQPSVWRITHHNSAAVLVRQHHQYMKSASPDLIDIQDHQANKQNTNNLPTVQIFGHSKDLCTSPHSY